MTEMDKTKKLLAEWSKKTGRPIKELQEKLEEQITILQTARPTLDKTVALRRARYLVYKDLKTMMRYPGAITLDGICLGYNTTFDSNSRRRREAVEAYAKDPNAAFAAGLTKADGTPVFKLPSGALIDISKPSLLRTSVFMGRLATGGPMKMISNLMRMDQVNNLAPTGRSVRFTVNKRAEKDNRISTTTLRQTKYDSVEMPEFPQLNDATVVEMLRQAPIEFRSTCEGLRAWHEANKADRERIVIVEANAEYIRRTQTSVGSLMVVLMDEDAEDLDEEGITTWVHQDIANMLDFGTGSRVFVIARTTEMPGYNRETREVDHSTTRIGLNAFGVFVDPVFKIDLEEATVFEAQIVA